MPEQTPGVWPVLACTWPTNEAIFDGAKSIVVLMDGGAKHPLLEEARRKKLGELADHGIGIVAFHQAVDLPPEHADGAKAHGWRVAGGHRLPRTLGHGIKTARRASDLARCEAVHGEG